MKKLFTMALMLVLSCSLVACGCQAQNTTATTVPTTAVPTTTATTAPATTATVPIMDPTIETNIPDSEVTPGITDMTEDTSENGSDENSANNGDTMIEPGEGAESGSRMRR